MAMAMVMVVLRCAGAMKGEGQGIGGAAAERLCSRSGQPRRRLRGRPNRPARRLQCFRLLNDRFRVQNVVLLQFRADNVAPQQASNSHQSHGAEGNRSRSAIGGLIASVFQIHKSWRGGLSERTHAPWSRLCNPR
jgi:hypothetical protein